MMRYWLLALIAALVLAPVSAWAQEDSGRIIEIESIDAGARLPAQRLSVWLPPGYDSSDRRYPVLYMHDGHNLFDPAKSNFNKVWAADKAVMRLVEAGMIEPHIIVGIWAPGVDRFRQYLPKPAYDAASPALRARMDAITGGAVVSDAYLGWIADTLKPWVDAQFRTRTGRDDTAIAGSSMGGLMSCYAFAERPEVFGRAACVSSHWPAADPRTATDSDAEVKTIWRRYFRQKLGAPDGRRLWMDHGTATLDAVYAPYQQAVDAEVRALGWTKGQDFESRVYEGAPHEENAWAARLDEVLGWLLRR